MKTCRFKLGATALAIAAFVLIITSCGIGERVRYASIMLVVEDAPARSILPPISMVPTNYVLTGTGPGGATLGPLEITGTTTIGEVLPGPWSLALVARNAALDEIGAGAGSVTAVIGQTKAVSITVTEYTSPNGSYLLDLSWEPDIVLDPIYTGTLRDAADVVTAQAFIIDEELCTATSTTTAMHPGWYANVVRLWDAPEGLNGTEVLSTGFAEAVRVAAGRQTHGIVALHAVQGTGGIEVHFSPEFLDPLVLTPTPAFGATSVYDEADAVFSVSADVAATFIWYLRGTQVGVGSSFDLDTVPLTVGESYRLDVIGFSVSGARAASGSWVVQKGMAFQVHFHVSELINPPAIFVPQGPQGGATFQDPVGGQSEYTLTGWGLEAGTYHLQLNAHTTQYWVSDGVSSANPADAADIVFPSAEALMFDFGSTPY